MKKLDIKSVLIGVLATALVFVLIGATSPNKNLGDIVVNSINVLDENGNSVVWLNADEEGGMIGVRNTDGKTVIGLGGAEDGGMLLISNSDGKTVAGLGVDGAGGGALKTFNTHNKGVGYFGSSEDGDGVVVLSDRYGDAGWAVSGKQ